MSILRIAAALSLAGSLLLGTGAATAASPIPGPIGFPVVDMGFPCFADLGRFDSIPTITQGEVESNFSIVVLGGQGTVGGPIGPVGPTVGLPGFPGLPTFPGLPSLPGLSLDGASLDLMKCFFSYPAGTVPNAPFVQTGFPCDYENDQVFHVFAQNMLIVRDTWALMSCLGTSNVTNLTPSPSSGRQGRGS